jgi:uncharacterized protein (DUF2147 family)
MERVFCALLLSLTTTTVFAQADSITGTWLTEDKEAHVEISESNNVYYGKIVWLREPNNPKTGKQWLDEENEDASKRKLPLVGSTMLWGFTYNNGKYVDGKIYDSRNGTTYSGKLWLTNNNTLKVRGYWGIFHSTETWIRTQ